MDSFAFRSTKNYSKLFVYRKPKYSLEPTFCIYRGDVYQVLNELEYEETKEKFPSLKKVYGDEPQRKLPKVPTSILEEVMKGERYNYFPNEETKQRRFFVSRITKKTVDDDRFSIECQDMEVDEMKMNTFYTVFDKRIREMRIPSGAIFVDVTTHLNQKCLISKNPKGNVSEVKIYAPLVVNGSLYPIEYVFIKNKEGTPQLFKKEYRFDVGKVFKKGLVPMNVIGDKTDGLIFDWKVDASTKTSNLIGLNHTISFELILGKKSKMQKAKGRPFYLLDNASRHKQVVNEKSINGFKCLELQVFDTTF